MGEGVLTVRSDMLRQIVEEVGSPTYVYDLDAMGARWRRLTKALHGIPHEVHYAVKANSNLAVLRTFQRLGTSADIVSVGELRRCMLAGFRPEQIIFSGVGKTTAELDAAVSGAVGLVNIESEAELESLVALAERHQGDPIPVGIRMNPEVRADTHPYTQTSGRGMKFGVPIDHVLDAASIIHQSPKLNLTSVGIHLGSQIKTLSSYVDGAASVVSMVARLVSQGITTLRHVDLGGGIGITDEGEPAVSLDDYAEIVRGVHRQTGLPITLEPGRLLVGAAGVLLTTVTYQKVAGGTTFLIVDAGMNDLIRPALYDAFHPIEVVRPSPSPLGDTPCTVVGPICESGDFLARDRVLKDGGIGAVLALRNAGAYGFVMASNYNSRVRAAEIVVEDGSYAVARLREVEEDLWRGEPLDVDWKRVNT